MGCQGLGSVDAEKANRIADAVTKKLESMKEGERLLADLSVSSEPKKQTVFSPDDNDIDVNELYSTTSEWLDTFVSFCRRSGGFCVM